MLVLFLLFSFFFVSVFSERFVNLLKVPSFLFRILISSSTYRLTRSNLQLCEQSKSRTYCMVHLFLPFSLASSRCLSFLSRLPILIFPSPLSLSLFLLQRIIAFLTSHSTFLPLTSLSSHLLSLFTSLTHLLPSHLTSHFSSHLSFAISHFSHLSLALSLLSSLLGSN